MIESPTPRPERDLDADDRARYAWQMWVPDFGEAGQRRLRNATVLVSRTGGLGSPAAYELAAAGVGRLVIAHGGRVKPSDLNRQLLMRNDAIGHPRAEVAARRLREFAPGVEVVAIPENVSVENAADLVALADLVVDAAPLYVERFAMNDAAVTRGIPVIECAMYDLEATITTVLPGRTPCLRCLVPEAPPAWRREFPVFGAVSGVVGCLGAMEAIKVIAGVGEPLAGRLLALDLRTMRFETTAIARDPGCRVCGSGPA